MWLGVAPARKALRVLLVLRGLLVLPELLVLRALPVQ
jgi:hypothetical protein